MEPMLEHEDFVRRYMRSDDELQEDGGWIEVKNLRTGDSGYVPENYLE